MPPVAIVAAPQGQNKVRHSWRAQGLERSVGSERRLAAARETFAQAERKIRMAMVLAGGGFPVEALPSLREGVELSLHAGPAEKRPPW
jgi:hypothetical protein